MAPVVPPLVVVAWSAAALTALAGCGSSGPAKREPAIAQVVVPMHSPAETVEREAPRFRCDEPTLGQTTRIEFRVQSATRDGSASTETRAVYTITPRTAREGRLDRAEVTLESLSTDAPDRAQSAWTVGLDAGWIHLRERFEIVRDGSTWCFAKACDDVSRQEFAGAIGDTAELLALPELSEQLTHAEGGATLLLPPVLMKRIGLGTLDAELLSPKARRRGVEFPALFVVERANSPDSDDADRTAAAGPLARAELLVSRSCRLQALKVELAAGVARSGGGTHRFSWSFDPLP